MRLLAVFVLLFCVTSAYATDRIDLRGLKAQQTGAEIIQILESEALNWLYLVYSPLPNCKYFSEVRLYDPQKRDIDVLRNSLAKDVKRSGNRFFMPYENSNKGVGCAGTWTNAADVGILTFEANQLVGMDLNCDFFDACNMDVRALIEAFIASQDVEFRGRTPWSTAEYVFDRSKEHKYRLKTINEEIILIIADMKDRFIRMEVDFSSSRFGGPGPVFR